MESSPQNAPSPEKKPETAVTLPQRWSILLLILTGLMIWRILPPGNTSQTATKPKTPPPRPIETTSVQRGTTTQVVSLIGQVQATQQSTLRAQTSGILQEILVQPGDRVQAGRVVAILEDSDQKLAIAQAQARLSQEKSQLARLEVGTRPEIIAQRRASVTAALAREREAQDNLERIRNLVVEGALSQRTQVEAQARLDESRGERLEAEAELAEAQAGPIKEEIEAQRSRLALAQAQLEQARLAQSRTRIISSQGGVVQTRSVSQGDLIEVGTPLITLVAGDRLDVFLELPEKLTGKIFSGMPLTLTARALPQWREAANITAVVPSADPTSRRQLVRVELKNPPPGLLPGMAIAGKLRLPATETGFLVSRDALTRRDNQWLIFTIEDGQAQEIAVDLVSDGGEMVAINHPSLFPGQEIVLRGGDGLQDGAKVKIVKRLGK